VTGIERYPTYYGQWQWQPLELVREACGMSRDGASIKNI